MYKASVKVSPLDAYITCNWAEILICLKYWPKARSKLAAGIGHLWSGAAFMAAQIWAINFVINTAIHSVATGFYEVSTRY